jgi:lambda family phage minor tail protein L
MKIDAEIQKLVLSPLVELFELMIPADPDPIYFRFVSHKNAKKTSIVWQGVTYTRYPIRAEGFSKNAQGRLPRPVLTVGNVGGGISEFLLAYDDLAGARLTRIRTLAKFLDAVNFPGDVNPDADPDEEFPREIWNIDVKTGESSEMVQFELCSPYDVPGTILPARQILPFCGAVYRDAECTYAGDPVATEKDVATTSPALDKCSKTLTGCRLRFGQNAELPFGGEPAIGLLRL